MACAPCISTTQCTGRTNSVSRSAHRIRRGAGSLASARSTIPGSSEESGAPALVVR